MSGISVSYTMGTIVNHQNQGSEFTIEGCSGPCLECQYSQSSPAKLRNPTNLKPSPNHHTMLQSLAYPNIPNVFDSTEHAIAYIPTLTNTKFVPTQPVFWLSETCILLSPTLVFLEPNLTNSFPKTCLVNGIKACSVENSHTLALRHD